MKRLSLIEIFLIKYSHELGKEVVVDKRHMREYETFSVFAYNTKSYLETGNISDALVGNLPLVIGDDGNEYKLIEDSIDLSSYSFNELLSEGFIKNIELK